MLILGTSWIVPKSLLTLLLYHLDIVSLNSSRELLFYNDSPTVLFVSPFCWQLHRNFCFWNASIANLQLQAVHPCLYNHNSQAWIKFIIRGCPLLTSIDPWSWVRSIATPFSTRSAWDLDISFDHWGLHVYTKHMYAPKICIHQIYVYMYI